MSAAGRDVTSPADTLRALLARELPPPYSIQEEDDYLAVLGSWLLDNGTTCLALIDAAPQARSLIAECLWDEEPWDGERLVELLERVYLILGGDLSLRHNPEPRP